MFLKFQHFFLKKLLFQTKSSGPLVFEIADLLTVYVFNANEYTYKGCNSFDIVFASLLEKKFSLNGKNCPNGRNLLLMGAF